MEKVKAQDIDVSLEDEIWADISGYDGRYKVSNFGRVKSMEYHNTKGVRREGILKPAVDGSGYFRCALSKENILITYKVHRLVAQTFIPNPNNYPQVNHLNGNKQDNRVCNLEWTDNSGNILHAYRTGLLPHHDGHFTPVIVENIITKEQIRFKRIKDAAEYIGVDRNTATHRLNNPNTATRKSKGFIIKYA